MAGKILVTGATGFIGSNLVRPLIMAGYDIEVLMRAGSYHPFLSYIKFYKKEDLI